LFSDSPDRSTVQHLARTGTYAATVSPVCCSAPGHLIDTSAASSWRLSHIYLLQLSRQCGWYLDAANQGSSYYGVRGGAPTAAIFSYIHKKY